MGQNISLTALYHFQIPKVTDMKMTDVKNYFRNKDQCKVKQHQIKFKDFSSQQ